MKAEARHVGADARAVVVLVAVTDARVELRRLLLPAQDGDAVVASVGALLALEHRATVAVVVVEGRGAQSVGGADPLRGPTADNRLVARGDQHVRATDLDLVLRLLTQLVGAGARHEVLALLGGGQRDERQLARLGARSPGPVKHARASDDVVLKGHAASRPVRALEAGLLARRRCHLAEHTADRHRQQSEHRLQQNAYRRGDKPVLGFRAAGDALPGKRTRDTFSRDPPSFFLFLVSRNMPSEFCVRRNRSRATPVTRTSDPM